MDLLEYNIILHSKPLMRLEHLRYEEHKKNMGLEFYIESIKHLCLLRRYQKYIDFYKEYSILLKRKIAIQQLKSFNKKTHNKYREKQMEYQNILNKMIKIETFSSNARKMFELSEDEKLKLIII